MTGGEAFVPQGRALLTMLYDAAVGGAAPGPLTTAALRSVRPPPNGRVHLFAIGKAAPAMAAAAMTTPFALLEVAGVVIAPDRVTPPHDRLVTFASDHPLPAHRSHAAARLLADAATRVKADDLAVVLLSGGTSSLIAAPAPGLDESDIDALFALLIGSGLAIGAMNAVRKRFTRWGAGRLAVALAPARVVVLVMSDVAGDVPADIGSGPCTPDADSASEISALLDRAGLLTRLPPRLRTHLEDVVAGRAPETPKPGDDAFAHVSTRVIGSNRLAVDAIVDRARALSLSVESNEAPLSGDAAVAGTAIARELCVLAARGERVCVVWGGETTVRLGGVSSTRGGRCQELALAAARVFAAEQPSRHRVTLLAAGTDGRDGPTDAAGAFADRDVWDAIRHRGRDPAVDLALHASYDALDAAGALFRCGPTGTNVMDVVIGVVH